MKSLLLLTLIAVSTGALTASAAMKKAYRACAISKSECQFSCESIGQCQAENEPNPAVCPDSRTPWACFEWVPETPARHYTHCMPVQSACGDCPGSRCAGDYHPRWCQEHGQLGDYACYAF